MSKVLITGGSGYIGSHLTKLLYSYGHDVWCLDINFPKHPTNPNESNLDHLYQYLPFDINQPFPADFDEEFDAVVHLAGKVRVNESKQMPIQYYITNVNGTMNCLSKLKTQNFIFASTGVAEHCYDPYGVSKRAAEDCIIEYCMKRNPKDFSIFRFYNVIGTAGYPATNPDGLMYNLVNAIDTKELTIFGNDYDTPDGTCLRDYVHVMEICESLAKAIDKPSNSIECLGHGVGRSVTEIAEKFREVNNVDFEIKYGPRREGDLVETVLKDKSTYMTNLYSFEELLKL
jgi:UDP-glucose 4-epimerase